MKILVVEDDFTNRKIMQKILSAYGDCDMAFDGNEAIEAFELALEEGRPYDLICMDIMMPNMDGQEALSEIRRLEKDAEITTKNEVKGVGLGLASVYAIINKHGAEINFESEIDKGTTFYFTLGESLPIKRKAIAK